ncbi:hypothetical protein BKA65DRAFT_476645 [Rhexocercosporidium sp. MPI-PUGE-AT-0058]|nr:hypothetical protein BKA65DRAFT_476645 [Rhexocercosporidium sp. MPI-PUGE-AT-0058]
MLYYLLFCLGFVSPVTGLGYYVDRSCVPYTATFDIALSEAMKMAEDAVTRLGSGTDTDFERVMERIFSFQKTDSASLKKVMVEQTKRKADVRIYCDNDLVKALGNAGRWEPRPNRLKGFVDNKNHLVPDEDGLGCLLPKVLGVTYDTPSEKVSKHLAGRSTITICDYAFTKPVLLKDVAGKQLENLDGGITTLSNILSFVILHELTHMPSCKALDQKIGDKKGTLAYGWAKSIALPTEKAIFNSDNYAFLGTFAWLAEPILGKPSFPGKPQSP